MPSLPPRHRLLLVVAIAALLLAGPWLWRAGQGSPGVVIDLPEAVVLEVAEESTAELPATVTVHVIGPVRMPGVVVLPAGSRVSDAIAASGGPIADAIAPINLARPLTDGEQIDVSIAETAPTAPGPKAANPGLVNLNSATAGELEQLPGVGPTLAARIVAHRTEQGPFTSVADLKQVTGIGATRIANLADLVTV